MYLHSASPHLITPQEALYPFIPYFIAFAAYFASMDIPSLDISYKCNYLKCGLL
jgi:hypothetical protein